MSKSPTLVQSTLTLLILKILELDPRTGWAISQRLRQMSNETLQASHGSLYPALHKLEHEAWIRGKWQTGDGARPTKIYSLTAAGRRQLEVERAEWTKLSSAVNGILKSA
jgi:transcriptional regulator